LETTVRATLQHKLIEVESKLMLVQADVKKFRTSTGDDLMARLSSLEGSLCVLESTSTPDVLATVVVKLQYVVGQQIIPIIRNLLEFYELLTTGTVGTCTPGAPHDVGGA
jgi:hypothetical protein